MRILVLGGGGFIGSHLVDALLKFNSNDVRVYDRSKEKIVEYIDRPNLTFIAGDIRQDHEILEREVRECDVVVDLIAHANPALYVKTPLEVFRLNFSENLLIAEYCVKHCKRLIQFSTCEVYGKSPVAFLGDRLHQAADPSYATFDEDETHLILGPVNKHRWIYSCAKQMLERLLHAYGLEEQLEYTIIRPFNFIGPKIDYLPDYSDNVPRVFSNFLKALMDGSPLMLVNGGCQMRSYTYIDDAIECIMRIIANPEGVCDRQIFNVGNPENETSILGLAELMRGLYDTRWRPEGFPLSDLCEVSGEAFYGEGYDDSDRRIPDITKAYSLLGWRPRFDLAASVEKSMEYWLGSGRVVEANRSRHPRGTPDDETADVSGDQRRLAATGTTSARSRT